ncbi:SDR family oxidoreductase [Pseudomonas sp. PA-3-11C]|jgi:NAD(P)-dependent dehydrogenase (short-subunit alcohol dehydrogenase family)|uniref:SDR family oxidoreductase n=1 Tax=Pseudomonas TaxID=286 RepID=UPI000357A585|nr:MULTISPECIES: SDR family oxidoreductase [Pseudomonas]OKP70151.1 3-oxoacyl-ACP reductase [Pseudomonas fluorescens]EPJ76124.1 gluconate 5-dehydrogenase protein [Pseudomonas sp. CFT9]MCF5511578.1 SDR family oxidoreductase [Pseudomonas sp. PA-3-6H]MCF5516784.1 SDR family oxidoreductase [Pseudomonas sp. PA-3-6E]MCF5560840.1 SDR family oxidoreductase [Pseudomonas sp. PA-3-5D]
MKSFDAKVVLVTGGSKGIGLACAQQFVAEGARVVISSRLQTNIDNALASLPGAIGFASDLTDDASASALVQRVEQEVGPIDVLVNSAGAAKRLPPEDLTPAFWRAAMDAKFFSTINVLDPVVKLMAARGKGVIVNIIGAGGKVAKPIHLAGGSANAALMLATAGLGNAYASSGVRVVGVNPGLTETGRVAEGMAADARHSGITLDAAIQRSVQKIPMGRMAKPEEIADLVLFLASKKASYITGTTVTMDGAEHPVVV